MGYDRDEYINEPLPLAKELQTLFDRNQPLTILEIGACEGEDSVRYARFFPNAKIFVFEPLPANMAHIKNNLEKYGVTNVVCYNKAVSSSKGTAEFYVSEVEESFNKDQNWDSGNKSSSLLQPDKHEQIFSFVKFKKKLLVDTVTIDSFCEENAVLQVDFIHMDVQGAELMVLKGASNMLPSIKVIWLEVASVSLYKNQPLAHDIKKFMKENGFVLAKNNLSGIDGDQLYVSKRFYPKAKNVSPVKTMFDLVKKKLSR